LKPKKLSSGQIDYVGVARYLIFSGMCLANCSHFTLVKIKPEEVKLVKILKHGCSSPQILVHQGRIGVDPSEDWNPR